jgi:NhaP-type Na+/H+ or K+/H+ antiporter
VTLVLASAVPGFDFADVYALGLVFLGVAIFAAIGALSHQHERAFSAAVIYLSLGLVAAAPIQLLDLRWLDPVEDSVLVEHLAEFAVIVALFATGLKLDRRLSFRGWTSVVRLLAVVMPLTIVAVAAFGAWAMGLSLGAAVVLGAALAPTDPVLAGDIGVGPPGDEEEREPNFSVTAEAGLNDGLAFPFVVLGLFLVREDGTAWIWEWLVADVAYAVLVGLGLGALAGYGLAALIVPLRERDLLLHELDGWLAVAAVLLVYGLCEVAGGYGFLAAFAAGLAFRRYERDHALNRRVHDGAETVEKFAELATLLLLGSMLTLGGLAEAGVSGWLLAPFVLLVARPLSVLLAFAGSGVPPNERLFLAWFGVRGIGSLYYVAAAISTGIVAVDEAAVAFWAIAVCVVVSVVAHGVTGSPLSRRLGV